MVWHCLRSIEVVWRMPHQPYCFRRPCGFHSYLSDEPALVCKSCFSVSITRAAHTIIEGSLPARRWSKTVGRSAKQYDFLKPAGSATNMSDPLTNPSIAFCCWCFKLSKPNTCTATSIAASICSLLYLAMSV